MLKNQKPIRTRTGLVIQFLRGSKLLFAAGILCSLLGTLLNLMTPQVIRYTVDSVLDDKPSALPEVFNNFILTLGGRDFLRGHLYYVAAALLTIAVGSCLCTFISRTSIAAGAEGFVKRLRDGLYSHIQKLPFSWHVAHQTGEMVQRCTGDVEVVRAFFASQFLEVFRTLFLAAFTIVLMLRMNVRLSLAALAFFPLMLGVSAVFFMLIGKRFREADEAEGLLTAIAQENLTGVRVVRAFGRERFEVDRFNKQNDHFAKLWIKLGYVLGIYWGMGDLLTGLQVILVIVVGTFEVLGGTLTVGAYMAFVSYNASLVWPIRGLGRTLSEMSKAGVSIDRLLYILRSPPEEPEPGTTMPEMDRDITFENVTFAYEDGKPVLDNISFTIPAHSTFGVLGGTGSGKTTIMHLLTRLYDLPEGCGTIRVGGVDIKTIDRAWVRKNIGIVLQEPFLYSRTIRDNIAAPMPDATFDEVRESAQIACVDDSIMAFEKGYDTVVGERGVTLSGGQKQRVAIARMLMRRSPVMIFDDSLSAVDAHTDAHIRAELRKGTAGATVILVSHRINTLMHCDRIIVLEDGRVAQLGTHAELSATEGLYKSIYDIQLSGDDRLAIEGGDAR